MSDENLDAPVAGSSRDGTAGRAARNITTTSGRDLKSLDPPLAPGLARGAGAETVKVFSRADMPGVMVRSLENCVRLWTTVHSSYDVCCMRGGSAPVGWTRGRQVLELAPSAMGCVEPGDLHRTVRLNRPTTFVILFVRPELVLEALQGRSQELPHLSVPQVDGGHVVRRLLRVVDTFVSGAPLLQLETEVLGFVEDELVSRFEQRAHPLTRCQIATKLVREYLCDNHSRNVSLAECARLSGLSRFHLVHCFREQYGISPHRYLTHVRLRRARDLLQTGKRPADVALATGFGTQSHMTQNFRGYVGITPSRYAATVERVERG